MTQARHERDVITPPRARRPVTVETRGVAPAPSVPIRPRDSCAGHAPSLGGGLSRCHVTDGSRRLGGTGGGGTGSGTAALPPPPRAPVSPHSPEPAPVRASQLSAGMNPGPDFGEPAPPAGRAFPGALFLRSLLPAGLP